MWNDVNFVFSSTTLIYKNLGGRTNVIKESAYTTQGGLKSRREQSSNEKQVLLRQVYFAWLAFMTTKDDCLFDCYTVYKYQGKSVTSLGYVKEGYKMSMNV